MRIGDAEYDAIVQRKLRELRGERLGGEQEPPSLPTIEEAHPELAGNTLAISEPKRRGRPKGSKNKPSSTIK